MKRLPQLVLLAAAAAAPGIAHAAQVANVHLPAQREVRAAREVTLGAIARLGDGAGDALADLVVAGPLDPGRTRVLGRAQIARLVGRAHPELAIEWSGSESVRVQAAGVPLDPERVRKALLERLRPRLRDDQRLALEDLAIPPRVLVPAGALDVSVASELEPVSGTITARLELRSETGWTRRVPVRARIEVRGPMLVAARDLRPGQRVAAGDVVVRRGALPARRRVLVEPRDALGLPLRAFVRAGHPLTRRDLDRPRTVEPGQPVQALLRQGEVVLRLDTISRGRGDVGDTIRVKGLDGRGLIEARVIGPGLVEIVGSRKRGTR